MDIAILTILWGTLFGRFETPEPPQGQPPIVVEKRIEPYRIVKSYFGEVTGYSSRPEETDDTPHTTASGTTVHWGTIATNAYPFGTKMRFPDLYRDRVFEVKDRMNMRYKNRLDIWFPEYEQARRFGLRNLKIEIIEENIRDELAKR